MSTDLTCPDCGGLLGADANDLRRKCTCKLSDTDHVADSESMGISQVKKICCICGTDVTGKKRAKDSRGYWCYDCHKAERAREKVAEGTKIACHDCGRMVALGALLSYEGEMICGSCKEDRAEKKRYRSTVVGKDHAKHEKRQVLLVLLFAVLLVAVILLHKFNKL